MPGDTGIAAEPLCNFAAPNDPSRPVLAAAVGRDLVLVRADGSSFPAHRFGTDPASGGTIQQVVVRGHYLLVTSQQSVDRQEIALLDHQGQLRFSTVIDDASSLSSPPVVHLGPSGGVAIVLDGRGGLVGGPGMEASRIPFEPTGPPLSDGTLLVRTEAGPRGQVGWLRPGATEVVPLAHSQIRFGDEPWIGLYRQSWADDRFVYLGIDGTQRQALVLERPGEARVIALPFVGNRIEAIAIREVNERFALIHRTLPELVWRVDLQTGEVSPEIIASLPGHLRRFHAVYPLAPRLDDMGALIVGLRDDFSGGLYRTDDLRSWTRLGRSIGDVLNIYGMGRGGTYLVLATSQIFGSESWSDPPPDMAPEITGDSLQLVRPAAGVSRLMPPSPVEDLGYRSDLSDDGRCFAWWRSEGEGPLVLGAIDVTDGRIHDLYRAIEGAGLVAWLPTR